MPPDTLTFMPVARYAFAVALMIPFTGCRSPYVVATVSNHTSAPISLIEVDYPSASFGTQNLAPGADLHYRFKVLGSGGLKLLYTDAARKETVSIGPSLHEGVEGSLTILIKPDGVQWLPGASLQAGPPEAKTP